MTRAPDSEKQQLEVTSGRVPMMAVSLAALAIIGAATANSLPSFGGLSFPRADWFSLPDFSRFSPPNSTRVAALPPPNPAPVLIPDPVVRAGLRDIQSSQQEHADVLQSLTQSSATQQADLKIIKRQLALLTAQVNSLQNRPTEPLTTSSIPYPNPRARVVRTARRAFPPAPPVISPVVSSLPKPVGPVSVGGAPLSPAPTPGSGDS